MCIKNTNLLVFSFIVCWVCWWECERRFIGTPGKWCSVFHFVTFLETYCYRSHQPLTHNQAEKLSNQKRISGRLCISIKLWSSKCSNCGTFGFYFISTEYLKKKNVLLWDFKCHENVLVFINYHVWFLKSNRVLHSFPTKSALI